MRRLRDVLSLGSLLGLPLVGGCAHRAGGHVAVAVAASVPMGWRTIVTEGDRARLRDWRLSWTTALARASAAGAGARISAEGVLLQPDAALPDVTPPPGDYRCRVTKLGAKAGGNTDFASFPVFACRIARADGVLSLVKLTGSQRPVGLLFPASDSRMIFLGTMMLGDETMALRYGSDATRDMAGAFERIGQHRWRLVLPAPRWESLLDVIELVPA